MSTHNWSNAATGKTFKTTLAYLMEGAMRHTLLAVVLMACSAPAFCQTTVHRAITGIRTGWNGDYFAVVTAEFIQNPANCPTKDGYVSTSTSPGYSTYYAAALTAYSLGQPVDIVISNTSCALGRPMLIGINLGIAAPASTSGKLCSSGQQCCGTLDAQGLCSGTCSRTPCNAHTCSGGQHCCGDIDSNGLCLGRCGTTCLPP